MSGYTKGELDYHLLMYHLIKDEKIYLLWPDTENDAHAQKLKATVYRLCKMLRVAVIEINDVEDLPETNYRAAIVYSEYMPLDTKQSLLYDAIVRWNYMRAKNITFLNAVNEFFEIRKRPLA